MSRVEHIEEELKRSSRLVRAPPRMEGLIRLQSAP